MGLLALLAALFEAIGDTIKENNQKRIDLAEKKRYETIDFGNIASVTFGGIETAYRIEKRIEYHPCTSDVLIQRDEGQHYETKTVEYEVDDGFNYLFTIKYRNGKTIFRKFHESSWLIDQLLTYCENDVSQINKRFDFKSCDSDYETAFLKFKQMQHLYNLSQHSSKEDFERAAELKVINIIMANAADFNRTLYELMLFLLSNKEEGDILQKINNKEVSFLQQTNDGMDAYIIFPNRKKVINKTVNLLEKLRQDNNFRKIVVLTTGEDRSTISNPNIVVWDYKKIFLAYITAFKRIVAEP